MGRKFYFSLLIYLFISCGSNIQSGNSENIIINDDSNLISKTTVATFQDQKNESLTSTTLVESNITSTTTLNSTTTTKPKNEVYETIAPKVYITNCPVSDFNDEIYKLEWTVEAGSGNIVEIGILEETGESNFKSIFFTKDDNADLISFPTANTSNSYSYQIDNTGNVNEASYVIEISIISEQPNGDLVFAYDLCFATYTPQTTTNITAITSTSYPKLIIREISTSIPKYNRDDWIHWSDDDSDCQNIRHEVLQDETLEPVTFTTTSNCYVATGKWYGVYTATYYYSASELEVDHFVPLKNAHDSGGYDWSLSKKKEYANYLKDSDHLIAVQSSANGSKGANGPENWKPANTDYWCEYAYDWIRIKDTWGLTATQSEWDALVSMVETCPAGYTYQDAIPEPLVTLPNSTSTSTTSITITSTTLVDGSTTVPANPGNTKNCSDFTTYQEAKEWFDTYYEYYGDVAGLDGDNDLEPCESLPGAP